jgi:hypothetical protein
VIDQQLVVSGALEAGGDAVPVLRTEHERLQHEEIECALQELEAFVA